jgi:hypothetical protein
MYERNPGATRAGEGRVAPGRGRRTAGAGEPAQGNALAMSAYSSSSSRSFSSA